MLYRKIYKGKALAISMIKNLVREVKETGQREILEQLELKEEQKKFYARSLTVTGEMIVKLPGRDLYKSVQSFSASYEKPMEVDLLGKMLETREGIKLEQGRMQITAYRENSAENALERKEKDMTIRRQLPDPEITLYENEKKIVLNQVLGVPVVTISHGSVTYT